MRIPRIFADLPLAQGDTVPLTPTRSHYLANVLRLTSGNPIVVFDGKGGEYAATITSITKKRVFIDVGPPTNNHNESPLFTELAIGVSKGERMDWVVQKSTELGVNAIVPLLTERSEVKLSPERWEKKVAHWREVVISACEQCGRNQLPTLREPQPFARYISVCNSDLKLIFHPGESNFNVTNFPQQNSVVLLIGPEGGFSEDEVAQAKSGGFDSWALGPRILRTETAPIVALSVLQSYFGDL